MFDQNNGKRHFFLLLLEGPYLLFWKHWGTHLFCAQLSCFRRLLVLIHANGAWETGNISIIVPIQASSWHLVLYNTAHLFSKPSLYPINLPACVCVRVFESIFQKSSCFLITSNYFPDSVCSALQCVYVFGTRTYAWVCIWAHGVNQYVVASITEEHQLDDAQQAWGTAVELISSAYRW